MRRTKVNKTGKAPIFMRVTVNGQRADASTRQFIAPR
ncbi:MULTISPECIES: Arm DNA-binding domain-containing protein [Rikenellaceae]|nr:MULTISPECIES: Arm DNA-binding domain-containing protein [Rikenellaceae]